MSAQTFGTSGDRAFGYQESVLPSPGTDAVQALLEEHRDWKQIPLENTAVAAKKVAQDQDCAQAASSAFAGDLFGLEVLAENIFSNEVIPPGLSL